MYYGHGNNARLLPATSLLYRHPRRGAHLLLFFMAFVFGSFCTFCFHMLMYLFDEKCVLFPKLLSLTSLRHNVIYEYLPVDKETADVLPLDFLGTQWVEKSACYLPTYVPLISGIFGLVWTTMFLMCSTGSRALTGLQRPWRVLPPVFVFSLMMGGLCIYSSAVTHYGLNELCFKLGEITGSNTCTYTVNVATLAYERRIRGVYQAIRLTTLSAWLHTLCWLLSAALTVARIFLAVDFQLVRVNVDLIGDIDKMMQHQEKQIRTVSPDLWYTNENASATSLPTRNNSHVRFKRRAGTQTEPAPDDADVQVLYKDTSEVLYQSHTNPNISQVSLVTQEDKRLAQTEVYKKLPEDKRFIAKIVYDLVDNIEADNALTRSESFEKSEMELREIVRQLGVQQIVPTSQFSKKKRTPSLANQRDAEEVAKKIRRQIRRLETEKNDSKSSSDSTPRMTYSPSAQGSELNITEEMKQIIKNRRLSKDKSQRFRMDNQQPSTSKAAKKSTLKNSGVQTEEKKMLASQKVQISEPSVAENALINTTVDVGIESQAEKSVNTEQVEILETNVTDETSTNTNQDIEKETQTKKEKEKQD